MLGLTKCIRQTTVRAHWATLSKYRAPQPERTWYRSVTLWFQNTCFFYHMLQVGQCISDSDKLLLLLHYLTYSLHTLTGGRQWYSRSHYVIHQEKGDCCIQSHIHRVSEIHSSSLPRNRKRFPVFLLSGPFLIISRKLVTFAKGFKPKVKMEGKDIAALFLMLGKLKIIISN